MSWEPLPPADTTDVQGVKLAKVLDGAPFTEDVLDGLFGGDLSEDHPVASRLAAEVHDDFSAAPLGNFTNRVADSGQTYAISGDTTPKIEVVNGYRVLSIANATTAGNHSFYLQQPLTANCRFVFAKVMFGSVGSTTDSAVSLAAPKTSITTTPDANYDIGVHAVYSASGGIQADTWTDMTANTTSDFDSTALYGATSAPPTDTPLWCGWVLCENGALVSLTPEGTITRTKDSRYVINSGPYAWIEPYLTAGNTDVRPYILEWYAGTSATEASAALGHIEDLAPVLFAAEKAQSVPGRYSRGSIYEDIGNPASANTNGHNFTISGGTFANDGDMVVGKFSGITAANGNNKRVRVVFGVTDVFDTTAQAFNNTHWCVDVTIIRVTSTTFRVIATGTFGTVSLATYTAVTATAADALSLQVTAFSASSVANDVVCKFSTWERVYAARNG